MYAGYGISGKWPTTERLLHYALRQWSQLELYLSDGCVEIDNPDFIGDFVNLAENAIRPTKLGAKNWLFLGNVESGKKCAILYTIVENCRRLDINAREYLEDVLTRLPAMKASEATSLTPANWLAAHKASSRAA
jgi:transposase